MQAHAPSVSSARVSSAPFLVTLLAMMSLQVSNVGFSPLIPGLMILLTEGAW